jgi:hypothetical protein
MSGYGRAMAQAPTEIAGDLTPIRVYIGDTPYVICVGDAGGGMARVSVNGEYCAITRDGKWAGPPIPYLPGMELTVVFITGKGHSRELRTTLPGPGPARVRIRLDTVRTVAVGVNRAV